MYFYIDLSFFDNWRAKREYAGGGILIDQGIHMLDLFLLFSGILVLVFNCGNAWAKLRAHLPTQATAILSDRDCGKRQQYINSLDIRCEEIKLFWSKKEMSFSLFF